MRFKRLRWALTDKKADALLLVSLDDHDPTIGWLTGYHGAGALVLRKGATPVLIAPEMEAERAAKTGHKVIVWKKSKLLDLVATTLGVRKGKMTLALDYSRMNVSTFLAIKKRYKTVDMGDTLSALRMVKSDKEIATLKKSCTIASRIMSKCIDHFDFRTERDVANFLATETAKAGCTLAFDTIVASGKGSSQPHYETSDARLRKGFCVIDFGVNYRGYHSDITRTVYLGKPRAKEKAMYDLVLSAQKASERVCVGGKPCSDAYHACVTALGEHAHAFTHSLGHGIGLEIHEQPGLGPSSTHHFAKGMTFTLEPGVYFAGQFGIRIEDDYLIDASGLRRISTLSRRLRCL